MGLGKGFPLSIPALFPGSKNCHDREKQYSAESGVVATPVKKHRETSSFFNVIMTEKGSFSLDIYTEERLKA